MTTRRFEFHADAETRLVLRVDERTDASRFVLTEEHTGTPRLVASGLIDGQVAPTPVVVYDTPESEQAARGSGFHSWILAQWTVMRFELREVRRPGPHPSQDYDDRPGIGPRGPECVDGCDCWPASTERDREQLRQWAEAAAHFGRRSKQ